MYRVYCAFRTTRVEKWREGRKKKHPIFFKSFCLGCSEKKRKKYSIVKHKECVERSSIRSTVPYHGTMVPWSVVVKL